MRSSSIGLSELLRRGVAHGTLRAHLPPAVLFELFNGLLERALQLVVRAAAAPA